MKSGVIRGNCWGSATIDVWDYYDFAMRNAFWDSQYSILQKCGGRITFQLQYIGLNKCSHRILSTIISQISPTIAQTVDHEGFMTRFDVSNSGTRSRLSGSGLSRTFIPIYLVFSRMHCTHQLFAGCGNTDF